MVASDKTANPLERIAEAHAKGIIASSEVHGSETPGHVSAAADAARETAWFLWIVWALAIHLSLGEQQIAIILLTVTFGTTVWKLGRSAWLGWTRLERLHRIVAEERWEIEHHRPQEREELRVLYTAKGFQGKLLEDVLDVLMADGDRLLRVMIEEELGLSLEVFEHPLKQGLGAAFGAVTSGLAMSISAWLWPEYGIYAAMAAIVGSAAAVSAYLERNRMIPALIWNLGVAGLAYSCVYFLLDWFAIRGT